MRPNQFRIVMNILALGIGNLGGPDLFIILLIVLVLFGAKKLPDLARSLGQSMNEFRKAREDIDRELHNTGTESSRLQPCPSTQQVTAEPSAQQPTSAARFQ
jgi:sec-independent protein translocase protein TatA